MKNFWTIILILAVAMLAVNGCGTKNPTSDDPSAPNQDPVPLNEPISFAYKSSDGQIYSLDDERYRLYASFTQLEFTWQELDENGYQVMAYTWLLLCVADSGVNAEFRDSLYIAVGDPNNLQPLTGRVSDGFNGNYYRFRIHPDLYVENALAANHNYLLKAYHDTPQGDLYNGSYTNWLLTTRPWPVSGSTDHIFHVYENGEDQVDSLVYVVSYTLLGAPIDTIRAETMLEFPEGSHNWHFTVQVNENGTLEVGEGESIWIWIRP